MQVKSYTFQSPYPNQFQIGRVDPSSEQEEKTQADTAKLSQESNQTLKEAELFSATETQEVKPEVSSQNLIDVYA